MDNYFVEREFTPKDENGDYDFEALETIDVELFNNQLTDILNHKEVLVPTFNFQLGKKEYTGKKIKITDKEVLVIEGIHCLNDVLTAKVPAKNKFKIYISDLTVINLDDYNRISTTDTRIIRRIVRDNKYRGYTVDDTLKMWNSIEKGEAKHIYPYQEDVDCMFNSSLIYEFSVLKPMVLPLLADVNSNSPYYSEARRLYELLSYFNPMGTEAIPKTSLLREFIGGSCY